MEMCNFFDASLAFACTFTCAHPLLLTDCLARIIIRGLHFFYPSQSAYLLICTYYRLLAIGVFSPDYTASAIKCDQHIEIYLAPMFRVQATVTAALMHDTTFAFYTCAVTSVACGAVTIYLPWRLMLLKVAMDDQCTHEPCRFHCCFRAQVCASTDKLILATLQHRLCDTDPANMDVDPNLVQQLIPYINWILTCHTAPSQYVSEFVLNNNIRMCSPDEANNRSPVTHTDYPRIRTVFPCIYSTSPLTCACIAPNFGGEPVEIIDDQFLEKLKNEEGT